MKEEDDKKNETKRNDSGDESIDEIPDANNPNPINKKRSNKLVKL